MDAQSPPRPALPRGATHSARLLLWGCVLALVAVALFLLFSNLLGEAARDPSPGRAAGIGIVFLLLFASALGALLLLLSGVIRWALAPLARQLAERDQRLEANLEAMREALTMSDVARQLAYADRNRPALMAAVEQAARRGSFEQALKLLDQLADAHGRPPELEALHARVLAARAEHQQGQIARDVANLEALFDRHDWARAADEAARIEQRYPNAPQARGLAERVRQAREDYKHALERRFLEASQRGEVDEAMGLMRELDGYLSEKEVEPFREAARGVVTNVRENLAVQFKLAVHDHEWARAVHVGEQIVEQFPTTKMAEEVNRLIDTLRQRAAGGGA